MIIQCRQCRTKFRFDDSLMEPDGMWMRCSRCRHVFFQDNPNKLNKPAAPPYPAGEQTSARLSFEAVPDRPAQPLPDEDMKNFLEGVLGKDQGSSLAPESEPPYGPHKQAVRAVKPKNEHEPVPDHLWEPQQESVQEPNWEFEQHSGFEPEPEPMPEPVFEPVPEFQMLSEQTDAPEDIRLEAAEDTADEYVLPEKEVEQTPPPRRPKRRVWMAALWALLVIVVVPGIIYTFVIPEQGRRLAGMFAEQGRRLKIAFSDKPQYADSQFVISQIKIQDVQQRAINNYFLGNMRIVEGVAINQADFPVTRVRVKAELVDAYSVTLESRVSYAGNILTDEELMNLTDEEIQTRLSYPEGRENSNERVIPNGQIPFMIVFGTVPKNAIKTTVAISGAERLL